MIKQVKEQPMKRLILIFFLIAISAIPFVTSFEVRADCINNQYGETVCGKGECTRDLHEKIICTPVGGGLSKDQYGEVYCGLGTCLPDQYGKVWCSSKQAGGAAKNIYGEVKCEDGCIAGSKSLCNEAK